MTQPNTRYSYIGFKRRGFKSSHVHHWSEIFLEIRHQFIRQFFYQTEFKPISKRQWNLGSDVYFEYTSCYFKVVTLFKRNLFRVRLPYLLLIRSHQPINQQSPLPAVDTCLPYGSLIRNPGCNPRGSIADWWVLTTAYLASTNGLT
jgi:hypothetical protein